MLEITSRSSGFVLLKGSMEPHMLCPGTWESCHAHVGVVDIPKISRQRDTSSAGISGVSYSQVLCKINPEQFFEFARAQVVLERLQVEFSFLLGFFPVKQGIVFFTKVPITRKLRRDILSNIGGVYRRDHVFFCYNSKEISEESLPSIKTSLLRGDLPSGWEITIGDQDRVLEDCPFNPIDVQYYGSLAKAAS